MAPEDCGNILWGPTSLDSPAPLAPRSHRQRNTSLPHQQLFSVDSPQPWRDARPQASHRLLPLFRTPQTLSVLHFECIDAMMPSAWDVTCPSSPYLWWPQCTLVANISKVLSYVCKCLQMCSQFTVSGLSGTLTLPQIGVPWVWGLSFMASFLFPQWRTGLFLFGDINVCHSYICFVYICLVCFFKFHTPFSITL